MPDAVSPDDEVDLTVVVLRFLAADPEALLSVLAKYVVLARGHPGCRNVDLVASVTTPGRLVVIQKWASPEARSALWRTTSQPFRAAWAARPARIWSTGSPLSAVARA